MMALENSHLQVISQYALPAGLAGCDETQTQVDSMDEFLSRVCGIEQCSNSRWFGKANDEWGAHAC